MGSWHRTLQVIKDHRTAARNAKPARSYPSRPITLTKHVGTNTYPQQAILPEPFHRELLSTKSCYRDRALEGLPGMSSVARSRSARNPRKGRTLTPGFPHLTWLSTAREAATTRHHLYISIGSKPGEHKASQRYVKGQNSYSNRA